MQVRGAVRFGLQASAGVVRLVCTSGRCSNADDGSKNGRTNAGVFCVVKADTTDRECLYPRAHGGDANIIMNFYLNTSFEFEYLFYDEQA